MTKKELIVLINVAYHAANESIVGPMWLDDNDKSKGYNLMPYNAFRDILASIIPKNIDGKMTVKDPPESWQE